MLEVPTGIIRILVTLFVCIVCCTSSATASTAVTVSSEDIACLPPGRSSWSVTCVVSVPDETYAVTVNVKALDQFNKHSVIATCESDNYKFSSFAKFIGQSERACLLPKQNVAHKFNVTFSFTNATVYPHGCFSVCVRNLSCSTIVYTSSNIYEFYSEESTQVLLPCAPPMIDLPPAFHFISNSVAMVTCSALHGIPEAHILLTVIPAASLASISVTGMNSVFIAINATSVYHKAAVKCIVLNHAHYLTAKTSEILVHYASLRVLQMQHTLIDTTFGNEVDCSKMVESYPEAKYEWFVNEELAGRESIFKVSPLSTEMLHCRARNPSANVTVSVTYTLDYKEPVIILLILAPLVIVFSIVVFLACRRCRALRGKLCAPCQRRRQRNDAAEIHCTNEPDSLDLRVTAKLTGGVPASEVDDTSEAVSSRDAHMMPDKGYAETLIR